MVTTLSEVKEDQIEPLNREWSNMGIRISNKGLWHGILLSVTVSALPFAAAAQEADDLSQLNTVLDIESLYQPVAALPVHGDTAVELLRELQTKHYSAVEIDDNFSSTVFDSYLDALDSSHLYFLKDDVDQLSVYRYTLDDSLKEGEVEPGFEIYNVYYKRVLERLIYAINRVENHIPEMDFTIEEYIDVDREDDPYAASVAELDEIWRKRIKNSVLSLKLTGDDNEEIKEKLGKRYRNQSVHNKADHDDDADGHPLPFFEHQPGLL